MGWTPHTRAELEAAGADFSTGHGTTNPNPVIIYPQATGETISNKQGIPQTTQSAIDKYGGVPININVSDSSAKAMQSLQGVLGDAVTGIQGLGNSLSSGFDGLMKLITEQTANNNAFSAAQAQKQMDFQDAMNQRAMEFNSLEAAKNRDWQQMMSNTAHQREVADLKAAGLNPVLSASGGNGAAVGSGATAAGAGSPSGAMADSDQSGNSALASIFGALMAAQTSMYNANLSAQTNLAMTEKQIAAQMYGQELAARTSLANAELGAEASKYAAGTAYAAQAYSSDNALKASMYGSDKTYESAKLNREFGYFNTGNILTDVTRNATASAKANNFKTDSLKEAAKEGLLRSLNPFRGLMKK